MKLSELLSALAAVHLPTEGLSLPIEEVVADSRRARPRTLFVCLRGEEADGHAFVREAYARGCRAFLCEHAVGLPAEAAVAYVADTHAAVAEVAAAFYGYPAHRLTLIGITGTKGKSTVAAMITKMLLDTGVPAAYLGSGGAFYADRQVRTENTTPDALTLHRLFAEMLKTGIRAVVMEVSSQAISTGRILGLSFPIALFTNLAQDHIGAGEHPDFAHYRDAKARLFSDHGCRRMIVNLDDESTPYMIAGATATRIIGVSLERADADCYADRLRASRTDIGYGSSFLLHAEGKSPIPVTLSVPGACNVENALMALAAAREYLREYEQDNGNADYRTLALSLPDLYVPGRFEEIPTALTDVTFFVDYAHNGYSLAAALSVLREYSPARLVLLFGSVGSRTYSRRTQLAEAACGADFCIVTTDNPDSEEPLDSMREICRVLDERGREYVAIPDREEAIRYAVRHARTGDLVLLAGKGHEDYQLIRGERVHFSEKEILRREAEECVTKGAFAPPLV